MGLAEGLWGKYRDVSEIGGGSRAASQKQKGTLREIWHGEAIRADPHERRSVGIPAHDYWAGKLSGVGAGQSERQRCPGTATPQSAQDHSGSWHDSRHQVLRA